MLTRVEPPDAEDKGRRVNPGRPWRVSLVGFGAYAQRGHLPAYLRTPSFELTAIADPVTERRRAAQRMAPGIAVHASLEDMLNDDAVDTDIVDICSPPALHFDHARAAILAGKHVFCEKPVVPRLELLRNLRSLAGHRGLQILAGHNYRFAPGIRRLAEMVKAGSIGTASRIQIDVDRTSHSPGTPEWRPDWRRDASFSGGGILMDHGPHTLSVALGLAAQTPIEISAKVECAPESCATEDAAALALAFRGMEVHITLTWKAAQRRTFYRVTGTDGDLSLDDYSTLVLRQRGGHQTTETFATGGPHLWTQTMLSAYGRTMPDCDAEDTAAELWNVTEALELAYASSRQNGRPLTFRGMPQEAQAGPVHPTYSGGTLAV